MSGVKQLENMWNFWKVLTVKLTLFAGNLIVSEIFYSFWWKCFSRLGSWKFGGHVNTIAKTEWPRSRSDPKSTDSAKPFYRCV